MRFDQLNFKNLTQLVISGMVIRLPKLSARDKICKVCLIRKQSKNLVSSYLQKLFILMCVSNL